MILDFLSRLISPVSGAVKSYNEGKTKIRQATIDMKVAKLNAQAKRFEKTAEIEADWDLEALRQSQYSWKDEWLTIIITVPFVGLFIPNVQDYVIVGFANMSDAPVWYQTIFMGIVAASFGLRWFIGKKGV